MSDERDTVGPMSQPRRQYTLDDYFAVEEMSPVKHEFGDGEIFAMAGALAAVPVEIPLREIYREVLA